MTNFSYRNNLNSISQLSDILLSKLPAGSSGAKVDMIDYATRVSLDIIGITGFNYHFNSLTNKTNEFSDSFSTIARFANELRYSTDRVIVLVLKGMIPILRPINLDEKSRDVKRAVDNIGKVSIEIVAAEKKRVGSAILEQNDEIGKSKDLLSIIMRANAGLGKDVRSLTDLEMAHQIPTFLLAGMFNIIRIKTLFLSITS